MSPPPRQPPALMDELVEEILFRLPPGDPASLVRAALACKSWCRLVSDPGFRRRFREFHRTAPMLGFVYRRVDGNCFVPTSSFRPSWAERLGPTNWCPVDARHGLILFYDHRSLGPGEMSFIVSNPIAGEVRRLPMPRFKSQIENRSAALLCGTAGCDHLDCPCGPFLVVLVATERSEECTSACVYSSETGTWSKTTSVKHPKDRVMGGHSALVGNALYFLCSMSNRILEYHLDKRELAVISLPSACRACLGSIMTMDYSGLGFAVVQESKLYIWSKESSLEGWAQHRVIELESFFAF